jgi:hypothetical protein
MLSRRDFLIAFVVGSLVLPTAALSHPHFGTGNNNGNGNIGSGNGNCNSGSNNGNGNIGNNQGNGKIPDDDRRRMQMKQLREQLKDIPMGDDFWKMLPDCLSE